MALAVTGLIYLIGLTPTRMVAAGGVPPEITPNETLAENPRLGRASGDFPAKSDNISVRCLTNSLSGPSTETPNATEPAGCTVSRLSRIWILDFVKASMICVARIAPSVSLEYDLISTRRVANAVNDANAFCWLSFNRRGAIAASKTKFLAVNSAVSLFASPASFLAVSAASCASPMATLLASSCNFASCLSATSRSPVRRISMNWTKKSHPAATTVMPTAKIYMLLQKPTLPVRSWVRDIRAWISGTFTPFQLILVIVVPGAPLKPSFGLSGLVLHNLSSPPPKLFPFRKPSPNSLSFPLTSFLKSPTLFLYFSGMMWE